MQLMRVSAPTGYVRPNNEVHTEFPKFVHFKDGRPSQIVCDASEEESLLAGNISAPAEPVSVPETAAPVPVLVGENDEREMLIRIAGERGIKIDRRWKTSKMRKALDAAFPPTEA